MPPSEDFIPRIPNQEQIPPSSKTLSGPNLDFIPRTPRVKGGDPTANSVIDEEFKQGTKDFHKSVAHTLPLVLGIGGGMFAGPGGAAVGSATGSLVDSTISKEEPLTPGEALKIALLSGGSTYAGGKLLGPIEGRLAQALASTVFGKAVKTAQGDSGPSGMGQVADFGTDFGLNLALGAGGELVAKGLGKNVPDLGTPLGSEASRQREQLRIGTGPTTEQGKPSASSAELGASGRTTAVANRAQAKAMEDRAYGIFRTNHEEPNSMTVQKLVRYEESKVVGPNGEKRMVPITEPATIKGAIPTAETTKFAAEVLPELEGWIKGDAYQKLPPAMQGKYIQLREWVKDLATPTTIVHNGEEVDLPMKEFETLKKAKSAINASVGGKPGPNFPEAGLKKLATVIDADQNFGVSQVWKNGAEAQRALEVANRSTQLRKGVFDTKENQSRVFGKFENGKIDTRLESDPSQFFKEAYTSPEKAKRLMGVLGQFDETKVADFKQDYFDNKLMRASFGPDNSKFQPNKMIEMLEDPNGVGRVILNADERNNLLRFARAAQASGDNESSVKNAFAVTGAKIAISMGSLVSKFALGTSAPGNYATRLAIASKDFLQAVKDKPQLGEVAARLLKVRPESLEAQSQMKLVLKALKGVPMSVTVGGTTRDATVGDGGRIQFTDGQ